jgi:hypothetical protein
LLIVTRAGWSEGGGNNQSLHPPASFLRMLVLVIVGGNPVNVAAHLHEKVHQGALVEMIALDAFYQVVVKGSPLNLYPTGDTGLLQRVFFDETFDSNYGSIWQHGVDYFPYVVPGIAFVFTISSIFSHFYQYFFK